MSLLNHCSYCKAKNTITCDFKTGQVACTNCGTVQEDRIIDETQDWRNPINNNSKYSI